LQDQLDALSGQGDTALLTARSFMPVLRWSALKSWSLDVGTLLIVVHYE